MKRNLGSQLIAVQLVSATDGSNVTSGTTTVAVELDGVPGTGGTATHIANGKWEYWTYCEGARFYLSPKVASNMVNGLRDKLITVNA